MSVRIQENTQMFQVAYDAEARAQELLRRKEWYRAKTIFDQLLGPDFSAIMSKDRVISYLVGRSECCSELGLFESAVLDCHNTIKLLPDDVSNNVAKIRRRLVHALISLRRFTEAEAAVQEWLASGGSPNTQHEAAKILERLQMSSGPTVNNRQQDQQNLDELLSLGAQMESWTGLGICDQLRQNRKHPVELLVEAKAGIDKDPKIINSKITYSEDISSYQRYSANHTSKETSEEPSKSSSTPLVCSYCCISFTDHEALRSHCQTSDHQMVIMSDEGRDWVWRPPPRGFTADSYTLCERGEHCRYGAQCVEAHNPEELTEWHERFNYRRMRLQRACEKELYGKSYTEQLLERWVQASRPEKVLSERVEAVEERCSENLTTTISAKISHKEWTFILRTPHFLKVVALLQDAHRNHFAIEKVSLEELNRNVLFEWENGNNDQEWIVSTPDYHFDKSSLLEHRVTVSFKTEIYGTFRQSAIFDFGFEPVMVRHLCVDVVPVTDMDRVKEMQKEIVLASIERWDSTNSTIIAFPLVKESEDRDRERSLLSTYPNPSAENFSLTQSTIVEKKLTRNNYRARMHELLCVEEMARYEQVAQYNVNVKLQLASCYLLTPSGSSASTAKYAQSGELFAVMNLGKDISEDTSAGRLILNNCTTVLLAPRSGISVSDKTSTTGRAGPARVVYEALIEDKGKNVIYLRLSANTVNTLNLEPDTELQTEVQFQLNRIPYCEWHYAIDKMADFHIIFPDTYLEPNIPWTPQRQWSEILDSKLNLKQKEAVVAITTPVSCPLPPILIIGPFGTGKTYTLAQAIKQLLLQPKTHILVCTHSNSAADLYIKDYLHPYVESGNEYARPLRIYYHKRWVATVNQVVQKYCLIELKGGGKSFCVPTLADIMKHRVVVVTLSISMYLSTLGLPKGHFSHILLDEAAQAMECEAIMPLALASPETRIVLAGDHMQLSPELYSSFARERNLHVSLLERLYDHYPASFPCKILLCENYRAHEAIIQFTSELFYDQKLVSSGKQPRHEKFYPLTFFTTRGEDVQDINSTAFYNNSEVYEIVERVCELKKVWPSSWGKMDDQSIGIMTPYADQVFRIRSELRKRRMGGISVERVLNVQGKQFRAIFLSTVRTRRTCFSQMKDSADEFDYGFLSNSKLLNTAITRAQSLVAVIGDPIALCSVGRCRKVWERFIEICNSNQSLFGITWTQLRSQLDGVELKKTYVLNPLAPEFIPRQYHTESFFQLPSMLSPFGVPPLRFSPVSQPPCLPPHPPQYIPPFSLPALYYCSPQIPPPLSPAAGFFPLQLPPPRPLVCPPAMSNPVMNTWGLNFPSIPASSPVNRNKPPPPILRPSLPSTNDIYIPGHPPFLRPYLPFTDSSSVGCQLALHQGKQADPVAERHGNNKADHIQFLHNVHFPEKLQQPDLSCFLPPNINLVDFLESHSRQLEWYHHLFETVGPEPASRFLEFITSKQTKAALPTPENVPTSETFDEKNNQQICQMNNLVSKAQNWFSGLEKPTDIRLYGPREMSPLRESEQVRRSEERGQSKQQSLPLYQRQSNWSESQRPTPVHTLLEGKNTVGGGSSSGAFAGYAKAAVSIGLQPFHTAQNSVIDGKEDMESDLRNGFACGPTYASVVRAQGQRTCGNNISAGENEVVERGGDPFAVLRTLGSRGHQGSGLYHYFS